MSLHAIIERYNRVSWAVLDQVLVSGASFVTTMLIARFLGKAEFGRFVLAWLAVWIIQNIQIALITTPITTFAMREPKERQPAYFGAVWVQQAIFAVITTLLAYGLAVLSMKIVPDWRLGDIAMPLALVVLFGQIADIQRRYFYIHDQTHVSFVLDGARHGCQIAGLVALFLQWPAQASLGHCLWIIAGSNAVGCLTGWSLMRPAHFEWATVKQVTRRHWRFSRWLLGATLVNSVREAFVNMSVGTLLGLTEVGVLRAVQQLVYVINIPLYVMHNIVPAPASVAYGARGFCGLLAYMRGFALKYFCFLCTLLLLIGAFGEPLLTTIYGSAYAGYGMLVLAYAVIMVIFLIRDFLAIIVRTTENTDVDFYAGLLGSAFCFVLLFPLVRQFGLAGALLTEGLMQVGILAMIARGLRTHWRGEMK